MNPKPRSLIPCLIGVALTTFVVGCKCCRPAGDMRNNPNDSTNLESEPCEPNSQLAIFGFTTSLNVQGFEPANSKYKWFLSHGGEFAPLMDSDRIIGASSNVLTIKNFAITDVGFYAVQIGGDAKRPFPCDRVYNLMGTTNVSGIFTVFGTPLASAGNGTSSYCGALPCPGPYAQYVPYPLGWKPAGAPGTTKAMDGNATTKPNTKIRYYCSPLPAPGPTPPTCGCSGEIEVLNPNLTKTYTFNLYFPAGVTPSNPHPITLNNFVPR